jgi:hypothetical protein
VRCLLCPKIPLTCILEALTRSNGAARQLPYFAVRLLIVRDENLASFATDRDKQKMLLACVVLEHASGNTLCSEDDRVTRQIVEAGKLLSIDVLDHLVICQARWVNLKERGLGF